MGYRCANCNQPLFLGSLLEPKDARIAALKSALAKAEEALVMVRGMSGLTWTAPHYERVNSALAAIKEARHD